MQKLTHIFFDLDETLVHTRLRDEANSFPAPPTTECAEWATWLRPTARILLNCARTLGLPVMVCTTAQKAYAMLLSDALNLGFQCNEILAREHLCQGQRNLSPNSVLLDDRAADDEAIQLKHRVLGISQHRHFQIPPFTGMEVPDDELWASHWQQFLSAFRQRV